jgi:glycosyltransferase involved in cell wall biosynthesis
MQNPRVAVLVDLPREAAAGGHVKYWERLAHACAKENAPIDLTVYFSGKAAAEVLSPRVRFRSLPPVFSTARLPFLPYIPAHTDLAPFHPKLAHELASFDVLHATDGFFAFAQTAERVAHRRGIPLVTSFHTDTPAYTEVFTQQMLQSLLGQKLGNWANSSLKLAAHERRSKESRLDAHLRACDAVLAMRPQDKALAESIVGSEKVMPMRLGVDKELFTPRPEVRLEIERAYKIERGKFLVLFVGRVDAGKNVPLLLKACREVLRRGVPLHLLVAGLGPLSDEVKAFLGENATLAGLVPTEKLAKFYASADCLAMASNIEIGGLVGVEALSCGCPVLASKASGVVSLCDNTPAMKEVANDAVAWANALAFLAQDKTQQSAMRAAARAFRYNKIAGWDAVLKEDFLPVWLRVARKE